MLWIYAIVFSCCFYAPCQFRVIFNDFLLFFYYIDFSNLLHFQLKPHMSTKKVQPYLLSRRQM